MRVGRAALLGLAACALLLLTAAPLPTLAAEGADGAESFSSMSAYSCSSVLNRE